MNSFKSAAINVAGSLGGFALGRRRFKAHARILAYHGVEPEQDPVINFDGFQVTPDVFRRQLDILRAGYTVRPLLEIVQALRGEMSLPPHTVAITFDDGYLNNLTMAAPILREYGFHATFFVTTGFIDGTSRPWWYDLRDVIARTHVPMISDAGLTMRLASKHDRMRVIEKLEGEFRKARTEDNAKRMQYIRKACGIEDSGQACPMMSWDNVRKLVALGFDVGPHTSTHPSMAHESTDTIRAEIDSSLKRLKKETNRSSTVYSYPYGGMSNVTDKVITSLREAGCIGAVTTLEGMNGPGEDIFRLKRLNVTGNHDAPAFESLVSGITMLVRRKVWQVE